MVVRWIIGVCTALSLSFAAASAQTFEEALALAYDTNPQLQAQRAQLRAIDEDLAQARAGRLPTVNGETGFTWSESRREPDFGDPSVQSEDLTAGLAASQTLYAGGAVSGALDEARAAIESGRADLKATEQQVLFDASTAYLDVWRDEEILAIRANNVTVLSEQLDASQARFDVGQITRTDVAQAQARLASARSQLAAARAQLSVSRAAFERVISRAPGTLQDPPSVPFLPATLEESVALAIENNPSVVAARFAEQAAQARVTQAKSGLRPRLSLEGSANYTDNQRFDATANPFALDEQRGVTAGVRLTLPLYNGGVNSSILRQASQSASAQMLQVRNTQRLVREAAISAWSQLDAARFQISSGEEAVRANTIAFDGVEQEAQVGVRTTLDVLDAEQELLNARLDLVSAQRDATVAGFAVLQAVGRLTAEDLGLPVELYSPDDHLDEVRRWPIGVGIVETF